MNLFDHFEAQLSRVSLSRDDRKRVEATLLKLFDDSSKKFSSDLTEKITYFRKRISSLASNLEIQIVADKFSAVASGDDRQTLIALKAGTLWFEGLEKIDDAIVLAAMERS